MIAVDLLGVVVFDAGDDFVEQLDELCGGLVGEARQHEGQDDGVAFHWHLLEGGLRRARR